MPMKFKNEPPPTTDDDDDDRRPAQAPQRRLSGADGVERRGTLDRRDDARCDARRDANDDALGRGVNFNYFLDGRTTSEDATETRRAGGISVICKENLADDDDDDG